MSHVGYGQDWPWCETRRPSPNPILDLYAFPFQPRWLYHNFTIGQLHLMSKDGLGFPKLCHKSYTYAWSIDKVLGLESKQH